MAPVKVPARVSLQAQWYTEPDSQTAKKTTRTVKNLPLKEWIRLIDAGWIRISLETHLSTAAGVVLYGTASCARKKKPSTHQKMK